MNFNKNHKIFEKTIENNDQKKIVIKKIQNKWYFEKNNQLYNLSPNHIRKLTLSPIISGADALINKGCEIKNINNTKEIILLFSEEFFLNCDVRLELDDSLLDGWTYNVISEKIIVMEGQKVWACDYLNLFYEKAPKIIYIKLESFS